jgi:hypothetical protein
MISIPFKVFMAVLKDWKPNLHVHRPPAVTLNETPEEFHISHWTMSEDSNQIYCKRSVDTNFRIM